MKGASLRERNVHYIIMCISFGGVCQRDVPHHGFFSFVFFFVLINFFVWCFYRRSASSIFVTYTKHKSPYLLCAFDTHTLTHFKIIHGKGRRAFVRTLFTAATNTVYPLRFSLLLFFPFNDKSSLFLVLYAERREKCVSYFTIYIYIILCCCSNLLEWSADSCLLLFRWNYGSL